MISETQGKIPINLKSRVECQIFGHFGSNFSVLLSLEL